MLNQFHNFLNKPFSTGLCNHRRDCHLYFLIFLSVLQMIKSCINGNKNLWFSQIHLVFWSWFGYLYQGQKYHLKSRVRNNCGTALSQSYIWHIWSHVHLDFKWQLALTPPGLSWNWFLKVISSPLVPHMSQWVDRHIPS